MNIALIFAGGTGIRMNSHSLPKQFLTYLGKPLLIYTLECFEDHPEIDTVLVVCLKDWIQELQRQLRRWQITKVCQIVEGGATSQDSIYNGLVALARADTADDTVVLIHDGVRPLVDATVISNNISTVKDYGNCITVFREHETFIKVDENSCVDFVGDRGTMRVAKAPQSFRFADIYNLHRQAQREGIHDFIDSASLMYNYGVKMHTFECDSSNIKVTLPMDYYIFKALYEAKENSQLFGV